MNIDMLPVMSDLWKSAMLFLTAQTPYEWGWRAHPMWGWGWGWGIGMIVIMLLFWGIVIAVGAVAIRWFIGQTNSSRRDSASEILRERFARGEIDKDEFEAKKIALR